jgi:hypothetical protein
MTTQTPEDTPSSDSPVAQPSSPAPVHVQPPATPGLDNRRRLRELLSVPERDRSDEQWDEIIELEIQLAPGNRLAAGQEPGTSSGHSGAGQSRPAGGAGQPVKKHRPRNNNNNRRPRSNKPPVVSG